jgi:hypothetical protein
MTSCATKASTPRSHPARLPHPEVIAPDDAARWQIRRIRSRWAHYHGQPPIRLRTSTRFRKEQISHRAPRSRRQLCGDRRQPFLASRTPETRGHMPPAVPQRLPAFLTLDLVSCNAASDGNRTRVESLGTLQ